MPFELGPTFEQSAPAGFDIATYLAVKVQLEHRYDKNVRPFTESAQSESFKVFYRGWQAMLFRLIACAEEDAVFGDAVEAIRSRRGLFWQVQYRRERAVAAFYRNALLAIDSFCFAAYGLGSMADPGVFLIEMPRDRRGIDIRSTAARFRGLTGGGEMAEMLARVQADPVYEKIRETHEFLAHAMLADRMLSTESIVEQLVSPGASGQQNETTARPLRWLIYEALNPLMKTIARLVSRLT